MALGEVTPNDIAQRLVRDIGDTGIADLPPGHSSLSDAVEAAMERSEPFRVAAVEYVETDFASSDPLQGVKIAKRLRGDLTAVSYGVPTRAEMQANVISSQTPLFDDNT